MRVVVILIQMLLFVGFNGAVSPAFAEEAQPKGDSSKQDDGSWFQCRKLSGGDTSLADLKLKMLENCNLNKPFSISTTGLDLGHSGGYLFCCHTKK